MVWGGGDFSPSPPNIPVTAPKPHLTPFVAATLPPLLSFIHITPAAAQNVIKLHQIFGVDFLTISLWLEFLSPLFNP